MSSWTYKSYIGSGKTVSASLVADDIANKLSELPNDQAATAKIGISDQHKDAARGVLFYDTKPRELTNDLNGAWQVYTRTFGPNSEYEENYKAIVDVLNGQHNSTAEQDQPPPPGLTEIQAATAKFAMSDYNSGVCHMMLFYQLNG